VSVRTLYPLYALSHLKRPKVGVLNEKRCITFGAYHAYIIRQEHKQQLDSMDIRNKQQLDEIKQIVRESKRSQWF